MSLLKPIGEIEDDSGKKASFGHAEKKAGHVELMDVMDEAGANRDGAPSDQNARDLDAGADAMEQKIAWHLEQEVAKKEDTGDEPELLAGDDKFAIHGQCRKSDVDAVEEGNDVENEEKRQQPDPELSNGRCLDAVGNNACVVGQLFNIPKELAKSGRSLKNPVNIAMALV